MWSATWPIDLPANTSGCALASSTVSGSSGQPGVRAVAGLLEERGPAIPAVGQEPGGRGRIPRACARSRWRARSGRARAARVVIVRTLGAVGRRRPPRPTGTVRHGAAGTFVGDDIERLGTDHRTRAARPRRSATRRFAEGDVVENCPTVQVADADVRGRLRDYVFASVEDGDVVSRSATGCSTTTRRSRTSSTSRTSRARSRSWRSARSGPATSSPSTTARSDGRRAGRAGLSYAWAGRSPAARSRPLLNHPAPFYDTRASAWSRLEPPAGGRLAAQRGQLVDALEQRAADRRVA